MTIVLGIDTGGTYTDAALVGHESGEVIAGAKALTTRHDLSIGIEEAVETALSREAVASEDVRLVALSTTLATNAIIEGQGRPICLLLIGYNPGLIRQYELERELVTRDIIYLRGGHDALGDEAEPLDEATAREAILARRDRVEGFAVSGYFGVRNPAHELRVRDLVRELTDLPVTCGHELTSRLDSVRRATTVALNARLIPLLKELIAIVHRTLDELGIAAPLMVVKGDGSLIRADWAMQRPIETILSGPAASVVGAWHLTGRRDVWTVDMGGTTTDIAVLHEGRPRLNLEGAQVGDWRTMVEAVDVYTTGLGGDSHVHVNDEGQLTIGPRRVVPLCLLATEYPKVVNQLRRQAEQSGRVRWPGQLALTHRRDGHGLSEAERALLRRLDAGPEPLTVLAEEGRYGSLVARRVRRLEARQLLLRSAFTPTDALHVLGEFKRWDGEASRAGAEILASEVDLSVEALCRQVAEGVSDRATQALVTKVLADESAHPDWKREPAATALLARALGGASDSDLSCQLGLRQPLVAIGAPVAAYMPRVSQQLNTELVIPPRAEVANAVGAVTSSVVQRAHVVIRPLDRDGSFRLHLPDDVRDFPTLAEGVRYAEETMTTRVETMAREMGADHIETQVTREDHIAPVKGRPTDRVYLGTELTFTAVGRPTPAARGRSERR